MKSPQNTGLGKLNKGNRACALLLLCVATAIPSAAQTFTILFSFDYTSPVYPRGLVQGTDGNLYGTTGGGGAADEGMVFEMTPSGTLTRLYSFCSESNCGDGADPNGGLVQATNGNFYGTTSAGGAFGYGTVFEMTPSGKVTTLYSFCSQVGCADGEYPTAGLIQASDGNLYGTTQQGGTCWIPTGCGTIFRIAPTGTLTTLYRFCAQSEAECMDGQWPSAGLIEARNKNLYGTTSSGGSEGSGTVFSMSPSGAVTTLYSFCVLSGCADGAIPETELVQDSSGSFYGTTYTGGTFDDGTVFRITPTGVVTTLYSFCIQSGCSDGALPSGLIQASDGNFYGTTYAGGTVRYGTVFQITPSGTLTTVYNFCSYSGCRDGANPRTGLTQATSGDLYGATPIGGFFHEGEIFSLSMGMGPFVAAQPPSGSVGAAVKILGTDLTGATSVAFNGAAAAFKVVSSSLITTAVPAGATTGFVTVTTPTGKFTSNQQFSVTP